MKFFVICILISLIAGSFAVSFRKLTNSHCKCIPKNYSCFRKGYRINFNLGRLPSACLPGLILCCDEGITEFAGSKESLSNKRNYKFNGSPRSSSEIKNGNEKPNIPRGSETILVQNLYKKLDLQKIETLNRNLKMSTSDHTATTPLTKPPKNITRNLWGSKALEINQSDTSLISHRDKSLSNLTNLLKIFRKSNLTRNIFDVEFPDRKNLRLINLPVTDSKLSKVKESKFPNQFPSFDPPTTNVNIIDMMDKVQRKSATTNTNFAIEKDSNRDIKYKVTLPNEARNKNKLQNYDESLNSNNLPMSMSKSVNFEELTKPTDIRTTRPILQQLDEVSIPDVQTLTEVVNIPDSTLLTKGGTIPSVATPAEEGTIPNVAPPAEGGTIRSLTTMAEVIIPPSITPLVVETNSKSIAEDDIMPITTLTEEATLFSTMPLAEVVTMSSTTPPAEIVAMPSTTKLTEEITMPNTTPLPEDMPNNMTMAEVTMSSIKPLVSISTISSLNKITLHSIAPLPEDMPSTTTLPEVIMPSNMKLAEVTMFSIKSLTEITMSTTTPSTEVATPTIEDTMLSVTSLTEEDAMPSVTSLSEEVIVPSVTPLTEETMLSAAPLAEEATMISVTSLDAETKMISVTSLDEETTMINVTPLDEETTMSSVTSLDETSMISVTPLYEETTMDEERDTILNYNDYADEVEKDGNFNTNTKKFKYENQSQTYSTETTNSSFHVNALKGTIPLEAPARGPYSTKFSKYIVHPRSKDTNLLRVYNESVDELLSFAKTFKISPPTSKTSLNNSRGTADANLEIMEVDEPNTTTLNNVGESKPTMVVENVTNPSLPITKSKPSILPKDIDEARKDLNLFNTTEKTYEDTTIPQIEEKESNSVFNWLFNIF